MKKRPKGSVSKLKDISYTGTTLAFDNIIQWLIVSKENKLLKPSDKLIEKLKQYRKKCHEACKQKPFNWN